MYIFRILFAVATLSTTSIGSFPTRYTCCDHNPLGSRTLESFSSESDGLMNQGGNQEILTSDDFLPKSFCPKEHANRNVWKACESTRSDARRDQRFERQRRLRKQRRSSIPPPDDRSAQDSAESPNPTMEEMRQFYSDEEMKTYIEHWRAGKEYQIRLYQIERGYVMTEEEEKRFKADRRSYNEARRLEDYVRMRLVQSNRARPKMLQSYERRLRYIAKRGSNMKERMEELRSLIENKMATPDEVEEYEKLVARTQRENESTSKWQKKNRITEKERMEDLKKRTDDDMATDAERREYEALMAKRQKAKERNAQAARKARGKKRMTEEKRLKELEGRIDNDVATDAERAEYDDLIASREMERAQRLQYLKEYREKKKAARKAQSIPPSTVPKREDVDQSNVGQPPQSPSDRILHKSGSVLDRLVQVWQASSKAQNRPLNMPPIPQGAPLRIPF